MECSSLRCMKWYCCDGPPETCPACWALIWCRRKAALDTRAACLHDRHPACLDDRHPACLHDRRTACAACSLLQKDRRPRDRCLPACLPACQPPHPASHHGRTIQRSLRLKTLPMLRAAAAAAAVASAAAAVATVASAAAAAAVAAVASAAAAAVKLGAGPPGGAGGVLVY